MTKSTHTKKALAASMISILLCLSMLIGSTFAWFTDNASTSVNTIKSGTLDIKLLDGNTKDANSLEGKTLTFAKAAGAPADEAVLFEPGAKYTLQDAYLYNAGNLHAKYQVVITGIDGSSKLAEVLDVYVEGEKVGVLKELATAVATDGTVGIVKTGEIAPDTYDTFGTIELEMQTSAGNEYQNLSLNGIAITVQATQAAVEYDSDDNQYDAGATYDTSYKFVVAKGQEELTNALSNAKTEDTTTVTLSALPKDENGNDVAYTLPTQSMQNKDITFTGGKDVVVDLSNAPLGHTQAASGATVTFENVTVDFGNTNYIGLAHTEKVVYKDCTLKGRQTLYADAEFINCVFENSQDYSIWTWGARNVTFTNCTFASGGKALLVYADTAADFTANVTLNNCTFKDDGTLTTVKAAVEVGSNPKSKTTVYNIFMNDCTIDGDGFAENNEGTPTGSKYWGNKNSIDADHLNVVIDGTEVY